MSKRHWLTVGIVLLLIPTAVVLGGVLFREKYYAWIALCVAVLSCLPLFYTFERRDTSSRELVVLAVLVALSTIGRCVFMWLPGFKPVTAITLIAAVYLGREAGFAVGALSAVISNFYFGQGPWTPFQMFAWGVLGFAAGCLAHPLRRSRLVLCVFGALSGIAYSLVLDVWTVLWVDGSFVLTRYAAAVAAAIPITIAYAVSNVLFLWLLSKPIGDKLERIKYKYGLFAVR